MKSIFIKEMVSMIKYLNKTVFNSNCDGLVNTINCVGAMGAGLALEFALRYPDVEKQYEEDCKNKKVRIGEIITYKTKDCLVINFPTKFHWKYPSKLKWIADGLDYMAVHYKEWNVKSIAIPPLGCNNGGLDFKNKVLPLIEEKLKNVEIDVYVCVDSGIAEGKEKEMLDAFNESNKEAMCNYLKIKGKAKTSLLAKYYIDRFYMIKTLEDVGITTYSKIFNYFYNGGKSFKETKQQTLFDI